MSLRIGGIGTEKTWLLISLLLISAGLHQASASTLVVDQGGRGDFSTIRGAVLSAQAGDVVQVNPGRYMEREIPLHRTISIVGTGGAVVLESVGGAAFRAEAPGCTITGIEMRGSSPGTGVMLNSSGNSIEGCVILNFSTGVSSSASDNRVIGSFIDGTSVGFRVLYGTDNVIADSRIRSSRGVELVGSTGAMISNTTFNGDIGVYIDNSSGTAVAGSAFLSTTGIEVRDSERNMVEGNTFSSPRGGIVLVGSEDNGIRGNDISGSKAAAITVRDSERNSISDNKLSLSLMGLYAEASDKTGSTETILKKAGWPVSFWRAQRRTESIGTSSRGTSTALY